MQFKDTQLSYSDVEGRAFIIETERDWRFVLWERAQYIPCWDIRGVWVTSEWLETTGDASEGYNFEPMHDKECRFMRVEPQLCSDALSVLKWHYALNTTNYEIFRGNTTADEFYSIFPSGYCVRKLVGYPGNETDFGGEPIFWEVAETIMINPRGTLPIDYLSEHVASYFDLTGDRYEQYWSKEEFHPSRDRAYPPSKHLCSEHPNSKDWNEFIIRCHFESGPEPFLVFPSHQSFFPHGSCGVCGGDHPTLLMWPSYPMWSHWPVYEGTDFVVLINATREDAMQRATHSSVVSVGAWYGMLPNAGERWTPPRGSEWFFLFGATDGPDDEIADLAASWLYPARVKEVEGANFLNYDLGQMSYIFETTGSRVSFQLNPERCVKNPLFILRRWKGGKDIHLYLDGELVKKEIFRTGLEKDTLYLWVEQTWQSSKTLMIERSCSCGVGAHREA